MLIDQAQKADAMFKFMVTAASTTAAIWTPRSSTRILLTGLDISSYGADTGTVAIFFSKSTATRGNTVAIYTLNTTSVISPRFSGLDGGVDVPLNVMSNAISVSVTAFGTEI